MGKPSFEQYLRSPHIEIITEPCSTRDLFSQGFALLTKHKQAGVRALRLVREGVDQLEALETDRWEVVESFLAVEAPAVVLDTYARGNDGGHYKGFYATHGFRHEGNLVKDLEPEGNNILNKFTGPDKRMLYVSFRDLVFPDLTWVKSRYWKGETPPPDQELGFT